VKEGGGDLPRRWQRQHRPVQSSTSSWRRLQSRLPPSALWPRQSRPPPPPWRPSARSRQRRRLPLRRCRRRRFRLRSNQRGHTAYPGANAPGLAAPNPISTNAAVTTAPVFLPSLTRPALLAATAVPPSTFPHTLSRQYRGWGRLAAERGHLYGCGDTPIDGVSGLPS